MFDGLLSPEAAAAYLSLLERGPVDLAGVDDHVCDELIAMGCVIANREVSTVVAVHPVAVYLDLQQRFGRTFAEKRAEVVAAYEKLEALSNAFANSTLLSQRDGTCDLLTPAKAPWAVQVSFYRAVRSRLRSLSTGPYRNVEVHKRSLVDLNLLLPQHDAIRRGVEHLAVYATDDNDRLPGARESIELSVESGETARLMERLPMKLVILDERAALVPLEPYGRIAMLIRDKALVQLFILFFELIWQRALPYGAPRDSESSPRQAHKPLVALMAAGLKDEAIARQLGVSVRTVRRQIADLCKQLGVSNRFAAGVAAWKAGLVTE